MIKEKEKIHIRFYSEPGSRYAEKHAIRIDDNGHKSLAKTGEMIDIYEKIQSHVDECDIEKILARTDAEGFEILNKREASTGDVTLAPKSLMEAQQRLNDMEQEFNHLPLETRKAFNFNFNEYIAEAGKDINSWCEKMGLIKTASANQTESEAADPETKGGEE